MFGIVPLLDPEFDTIESPVPIIHRPIEPDWHETGCEPLLRWHDREYKLQDSKW